MCPFKNGDHPDYHDIQRLDRTFDASFTRETGHGRETLLTVLPGRKDIFSCSS